MAKKVTQQFIYEIKQFDYYYGKGGNAVIVNRTTYSNNTDFGSTVAMDLGNIMSNTVELTEDNTIVHQQNTPDIIEVDDKGMASMNRNYIKYIMIENMYEDNTSGAIYISLHVPAIIYRKLLKNENTKHGYVNITIRPKNVAPGATSSKSNYIKGSFKYMIANSNPDYAVALESKEDPDKSYKSLVISLINNQNIDQLKTFQNGLYFKVNQGELVRTVLTGFSKVIVQPFHNNVELTQVLIPPMNNRRKLLEYIFNIAPFYNTKYTFFADFNYVYLVANDGHYTNENSNTLKVKAGSNSSVTYKIATVVFHIDSAAADESYEQGTNVQTSVSKKKKDYIQKDTYHIYVNPAKISISPNKGADMISNVMSSVDEDGVVYSKIPKSSSKKNKKGTKKTAYSKKEGAIALDYGLKTADKVGTKIAMRRGEYPEVLANIVNSDSAFIELEKAHINGQFLSPDKIFRVKFEYTKGENNKVAEEYSGLYYLTYKRELIRNNGKTFAVACAVGLKRVPNNITEVTIKTKNGISYESQGALKFIGGDYARGSGGKKSSSSKSSSSKSSSNSGSGKNDKASTERTTKSGGGGGANSSNTQTRSSYEPAPGKAGIDMESETALDPFRDSRGFVTGTDYNPRYYDMSCCYPNKFVDTHDIEKHI